MFNRPKSDFIFKFKQIKKELTPTCCSTYNIRKKSKTTISPAYLDMFPEGHVLIFMDELPLTFSFPKTDSLK